MQTYQKRNAIRRMQDSQFDDGISGLIVVIMSHGTRGTVEASNGLLDIHDVLMTMSSKKLAGKPKGKTDSTVRESFQ